MAITANGEVQTHEEATVYVKELDIFSTMKALENTPAVLSLGKLCDENVPAPAVIFYAPSQQLTSCLTARQQLLLTSTSTLPVW